MWDFVGQAIRRVAPGGVTVWLILSGVSSCKGVPLTAPGGAVLQISAEPLFISAIDGVSTITVTGFKSEADGGGPLPDGTQIFLTTPIGILEERVETNNGVARALLRSDGRSGVAEVTASSGAGTTVTLNPAVIIGTSEATNLVLVANPSTARAPEFTSEVVLTALDPSNRPLSGVPVLFSTSAGSLASAGSILRTDAEGRARDRVSLGSEPFARVTASSGVRTSNAVTVVREGASGVIVTGVSPALAGVGETISVTITGLNFESGASVTFSGGGIGVSVVSVAANAIQARLSITGTAEPGPRDVTVTNPDQTSDTLSRGFSVTAGGPTVGSVSPPSGLPGETLELTIRGSDFQSGARVSLGDGISVDVGDVQATSIAMEARISASARTGSRDVTVTNPDGGTGSLSAGFTVEAPPPTVSSVAPANGSRGQSGLAVTISGSGFADGATVSFGSGIRVNPGTVSSRSIEVRLDIDLTAQPGTRDVTVTNPGGKSATLPQGFTVN